VKTIQTLLLLVTLTASLGAEDQWRRVAFLGNARVKSISGLVEVIAPQSRILREGETAKVGETLRIYQGAELILQMQNTKSLVRAKGPVLLRLAPESEGFDRASINAEEKPGYVVRAVRGGGRYSEDGIRWQNLETGITLSETARVRPFRDSTIDLYHTTAHTALRLTDHTKAIALAPKLATPTGNDIIAAKAP
jgi:hypothetical protein